MGVLLPRCESQPPGAGVQGILMVEILAATQVGPGPSGMTASSRRDATIAACIPLSLERAASWEHEAAMFTLVVQGASSQ